MYSVGVKLQFFFGLLLTHMCNNLPIYQQSLASVAIPGGVINTIVRASRFAVSRTVGLPLVVSKWAPTAAGLGSIPLIIHPIDECVDFALDNTTRKMLGI